ncbi:MAG: flagellar biosynthetic protein FliR [Candidatus Margulisiibacteriota bacterium]|nr:MAG: flagellar biosynthetic protein FliR [Candidatus Margulisbacteria bacterium GWF2_38_17]OGI06250.1 MAG: flagellar biosynthetic protein FliR [Candidatus Margulisbacteria bacterium GWE2_39_32]PZM78906.1 MAG: flagellar biosynthetic protein FliR [Candidatus Margulisiibacteriota bacterium]HCT84549.1 flagellar biosynthetic protein FliR [Candidatus Margulisiibacteriota bacterium]HCY37063.1 flagellar biosynthetic protein FliR [Candidatus Margulisiibacteriota bacterium]
MYFLDITLKNFQIFLIVLLRISGIFVLSPVFGAASLPQRVKVFASVFFSFVILPQVVATSFEIPMDFLGYAIILFRELLVGVIIGFAAMVIMNIIQFAGKMVDMGMGLHMASVVDPMNRDQASVIGQLFYFIAILIFLLTNSHYYLISAVVKSFEVIPINGLVIDGRIIDLLLNLFTRIFSIGFQIAMPIAGILFILTFTLGIMSKTVPQLNVFFVGIPLQIIIGLILLMFSFTLFYPVFLNLIMSMKDDLFAVVKALGNP